jgi:DNA-binding protein WhiA
MKDTAALHRSNTGRQVRAAAETCARVTRALNILGDQIPARLAIAAQLRLTHPTVSLAELGQLADPRLTKDAVAGRIRRLLILAGQHPAGQGRGS